jgi:hypothetical protein
VTSRKAALTAKLGQGAGLGARLRAAARLPVPKSQCSVLLKQLLLRRGLGWLSPSDDEGLEVRRVSGRSSSGRLGELAAVTQEAGYALEVEAGYALEVG